MIWSSEDASNQAHIKIYALYKVTPGYQRAG